MRAAHSKCLIPYDYKDIDLSGFENRSLTEPLGENRLYVDVTIVGDASTVYFISIDTLYVSEEFYLRVKKSITEFDQNCSDIVINASHTHSAPNIFSDSFGCINVDYMTVVHDLILALAKEVFSSREDVVIKLKTYKIIDEPFIYRRKKIPFLNIVKMLPNYEKSIFSDIKIVEFSTKSSCWNWISLNCHPVFNSANRISSDFVGDIRKEFENCQFFQGFSGDIRPNVTSKHNKPKSALKKMVSFIMPVFTIPSAKDFKAFCAAIKFSLSQSPSMDVEINCVELNSKEFQLNLSEDSQSVLLKITVLEFSKEFVFIAINAEVSNMYLEILNRSSVFPSGCSNGMLGYLPTRTQLEYKGYENYYSLKNYGIDKPFSQNKLAEIESFLQNIN